MVPSPKRQHGARLMKVRPTEESLSVLRRVHGILEIKTMASRGYFFFGFGHLNNYFSYAEIANGIGYTEEEVCAWIEKYEYPPEESWVEIGKKVCAFIKQTVQALESPDGNPH